MKMLRAVGRLCLVVVQLVRGLWTVHRVFPQLSPAEQNVRVQAWALAMLDCLALQLVVRGQPSRGPVLLAANHISWADIVVMHAVGHCRFISKADVRDWPVVGTLATAAGTLYISRESSRDAMRVVHHMAECLNNKEVLAVFPEGTTGDGSTLLPFHGNLLQAAIAAHAPVQPVALSFEKAITGERSFAPCYIGDDTLVQSLWRTLCADGLVAVVEFGEPQWSEGRSRRQWALDLRSTIEAMRA
jgi:1-acyl-sn-glycerol-3-phosphate acyltransferase